MDRKENSASPLSGKAQKAGFLLEDYRLFHLKNSPKSPCAPHYHDFCKVLLLLEGSIRYQIEGRSYELLPGDIVLVNRGEIHCPQLERGQAYERVILYLSPVFLASVSPEAPLSQCFTQARYRHSSVLRLGEGRRSGIFALAARLEEAIKDTAAFASPLYCRLLLLELLVALNRAALEARSAYLQTGELDYQISSLLSYIGSHLDGDLSIGRLSKECCLSPSHLMHRFKAETGCTIGYYITQKRLALARELLSSGHASATQACFLSGFSSYSSFLRAYKRQFGSPPVRTGGPVVSKAGPEEPAE